MLHLHVRLSIWCPQQGGRASVIAAALAKNRELQKRLRAGLASLNRASHKLADLRGQVDAVKQKYRGPVSVCDISLFMFHLNV